MNPFDHSPLETALFSRLHAALPQTQCKRCGYPDCAGYAHAIADAEAPINQCPPGGVEGIRRLAAITGSPVTSLNPANGVEGSRAIAVIDEAWCIGCTLCLPVCPTDAILGSNKTMHVVIESHCTGCELCIPVCPVDCISLKNVTGERTGWSAWSQPKAEKALKRYQLRSIRRPETDGRSPKTLVKEEKPHIQAASSPTAAENNAVATDRKCSVIETALARARAVRQPKP